MKDFIFLIGTSGIGKTTLAKGLLEHYRTTCVEQWILVCNDLKQLQEQMKNRPNNGLVDYELQEKLNDKMLNRPLLVNEAEINVTGLSVEEVLQKAIDIIDNFNSTRVYDYEKPSKEMFYSWVFANGLR